MNRLQGRFAAQQIPGGREYQEDDYGLIERGDPAIDGSEVLLLADGMGGHVSGDTASRLVINTFVETYPNMTGPIPDRLRACLEAANNALASAVNANPELDGMGTTVVAVVMSQHGLDWISVGDSPLWLFREGQLRRLNADHSMAAVFADLVATGHMTEEEAATDPKRHALRSAVMGDEIHLIDVSSQPVVLEQGDCIVLASDGLETLSDDEITRILQAMENAPLAEVAEALIQAVEKVGNPHQDNTTVLLYTPESDKNRDPDTQPLPAVSLPNRIRPLVNERKKIGIVGIALVLFGLLYWFWTTTHAKRAVAPDPVTPSSKNVPADTGNVKTTEDISAELPSTTSTPKNDSLKTPAQSDTVKMEAELEKVADGPAEPISKDTPPSIESPAQRDTGKVSESPNKTIADTLKTPTTAPDTKKMPQSKGTR